LAREIFFRRFGIFENKVYHLLKDDKHMLSEQECTKILNAGEKKYTAEEVKQIRELLTALAIIEYEDYKNRKENKVVSI
jgi:hypothetical protein